MEQPRKLPNGKWQGRIWRDGKRHSLGTYPTKKAAQDAQIEAYRAEKAPAKKRTLTLDEFALPHLESRKDELSAGSYLNYLRDYRNHLAPTFGSLKLEDITPTRVKKWWTEYADRPGVRRAAYFILSNVMKAAVAEGEPGVVWVAKKGASKDVSTPRPTFGTGDVATLRMLAADDQVRAMLWVLVTSGLRIGEALALDWADVDFEQATIHVYRHMLRDGSIVPGRKKHPDADILQPIPGAALDALKVLWASRETKTGPVWLNKLGGQMRYHTWEDRWDALRKAYGLDGMHTHDIRAAHLTAFAATGATLKETMERGGHTDYRSAMRYQRPDEIRQREIVTQMTF